MYPLEIFSEYFDRVNELSSRYNIRLTFHPDHFSYNISSPTEAVVQKSIVDLQQHADVLDLMRLDLNSVMVVHMGGTYKDIDTTTERWISMFQSLPISIRQRVVIENCEKSYNYQRIFDVCDRVKRPFVFDTHHHECYYMCHSNETYVHPSTFIDRVFKTWTSLGLKPKVHISEQRIDSRLGAHSDYVEEIPSYLLNKNVDIMIEAKKKELAVFHLRQKYNL